MRLWRINCLLVLLRLSSAFFISTPQGYARRGCRPARLSQQDREPSPVAGADVPLGQVDQALVEAARRELQASDAEWYQAVILGGASEDDYRLTEAATSGPRTGQATSARPPGFDAVLRELGYSDAEAAAIPEDVAGIIVENRISRPAQGLPRQWLADWKDEGEDEAEEEEQEPVVVERRGRGRRRPAAVEPEVRRVSYYEDDDDYLYDDFEDYEEDEYEGYGGRTRGGKGPVRPPAPLAASDDFPATFSESEPGFFPLFVRSLSHAVQEVPFFKPLLREEKFKDMLSREADFRMAVAGPWLGDWLRDEYRWRLGVFRDYLRLDGSPKQLPQEQKAREGWRWGAGEDEEEDEEDDDDVVVERRQPLPSSSKRSSRSGEWRAEGAVGSRRGAGAGSSRSRRRTASEKPEWADFEEEENENEKSSTWSWVNSDATRGGGGRSRGRVVGTVVRGRYEDDDEEEEEGEIW